MRKLKFTLTSINCNFDLHHSQKLSTRSAPRQGTLPTPTREQPSASNCSASTGTATNSNCANRKRNGRSSNGDKWTCSPSMINLGSGNFRNCVSGTTMRVVTLTGTLPASTSWMSCQAVCFASSSTRG